MKKHVVHAPSRLAAVARLSKIRSVYVSGAISQEMVATRFANRETLREAARLCTNLCVGLAISGWAERRRKPHRLCCHWQSLLQPDGLTNAFGSADGGPRRAGGNLADHFFGRTCICHVSRMLPFGAAIETPL